MTGNKIAPASTSPRSSRTLLLSESKPFPAFNLLLHLQQKVRRSCPRPDSWKSVFSVCALTEGTQSEPAFAFRAFCDLASSVGDSTLPTLPA